MEKLTKKIIFYILIILITPYLFACVQKEETREYKTEINSTDIAELTLFSFDGKGEGRLGLANLGHAFLSIENTSDTDITVFNKTIKAHEGLSFGTWSILEHFGVWYNVESNYIKNHNKYNGRISITIGINTEDIETIGNFIKDNDKWNPINNCSKFAITLWNKIATDSEKISTPIIYTPTHICEQIRKFDNYEKNKEIITDTNVSYFTADENVYWNFEKGVTNE